ncbi:MAG: bifunctional riboflavin kinase/FAD synthetase [Candidatus Omnitrophica bacterium]|nr:bifunctional riboflavin kinase/FAD synthetase [Candidatus Omnitrophota bacterium]
MKLIRGIKNLKQQFKKSVLTIGIFDGVHLAHQKIIKKVVRQAKALKGTSMVATFHPHPLRTLSSSAATPMISSLEHRIDLINRLNVDVCLLLDFNKEFSRMCAEDFIKDILVDAVGINCLILGKGFRFGKERKGTFALLKKLSKTYGFNVRRIEPVKINGEIISSSKIRALIQKGKIKEANKFLGRAFSIFGKVKKGNARGRVLGYPTANITPLQEIVPLAGVYAVKVLTDNKIFPGVLNIGCRPTFTRKLPCAHTIETHIFNFHNKIYGKRLEVFFIQRIRPEKKFATHKALLAQIKKDEVKAKKILTPKI